MLTRDPAPTASTEIRTVASPPGRTRARRTSSDPGTDSTTCVSSSRSRARRPTEWWIRAPAAGHASSTSRIREAPTTQRG